MKTKAQNPLKSLKLIVLMLLISASFTTAFGQERKDKIKQLKIAYFTEELDLTTAESEKFWPIYNELEDKMKNLRKESKRMIDELHASAQTLGDDELKKKSDKIFENQITEINLRKEYQAKIAGAISYKKAIRLMGIEKEFKAQLIQELKQGPHRKKGPKQ